MKKGGLKLVHIICEINEKNSVSHFCQQKLLQGSNTLKLRIENIGLQRNFGILCLNEMRIDFIKTKYMTTSK